MKIKIELEADGYSDILKDFGKAVNIVIDGTPAFMLKAKTLKDFVETVAKAESEKRAKELEAILADTPSCKPVAPVEAAPETTDESAVPTDEEINETYKEAESI